MCATCGCGDTTDHGHEHHHHRDDLPHVHPRQRARTLRLEQDVLAKNADLAQRNRAWLETRGILAWNLMSRGADRRDRGRSGDLP